LGKKETEDYLMLYRKDGIVHTRSSAINNILKQLGSVVQPSYIDDETLLLYGYSLVSEPIAPNPTKEQRKAALESVDWVTNASHLSEETKESVEAWRWLVRNLTEISDKPVVPPLPPIQNIKNYFTTKPLTEKEIDKIKNYSTKDEGWIVFLQTWKDLGFPCYYDIISNLLTAYTKVKLDEIIGSI
jgi:hypothetical protein